MEELLLETIQSCFGKIQFPDSTIEEIINYLRSIHDSEWVYHREQLKTVQKDGQLGLESRTSGL